MHCYQCEVTGVLRKERRDEFPAVFTNLTAMTLWYPRGDGSREIVIDLGIDVQSPPGWAVGDQG